MIDLRFAELPSQIECDGFFYDIDTDFRTWIEFDRILREERVAWPGIFVGERPSSLDWIEGAREFLVSENVTPKYRQQPRFKLIDLILDGDYIVAAFQQAYGIDLTDGSLKMHWHRFKALLAGLPDDTVLSKAIMYRGYVKNNKKQEQIMQEQHQAWQLPEPDIDVIKEQLLELANAQMPMRDDIY